MFQSKSISTSPKPSVRTLPVLTSFFEAIPSRRGNEQTLESGNAREGGNLRRPHSPSLSPATSLINGGKMIDFGERRDTDPPLGLGYLGSHSGLINTSVRKNGEEPPSSLDPSLGWTFPSSAIAGGPFSTGTLTAEEGRRGNYQMICSVASPSFPFSPHLPLFIDSLPRLSSLHLRVSSHRDLSLFDGPFDLVSFQISSSSTYCYPFT
ncbi:hypothetical protein BDY24DRAFT_402446 [Mrakia frigida]|uniref:uncharacterized protein n=1 Tax=Mrakia frigida TaxID=29902 RepID=UPI003FCC1EC9